MLRTSMSHDVLLGLYLGHSKMKLLTINTALLVHIIYFKDAQIVQKVKHRHNTVGTRTVTGGKIHNEELQIFGAVIQNLITWVT